MSSETLGGYFNLTSETENTWLVWVNTILNYINSSGLSSDSFPSSIIRLNFFSATEIAAITSSFILSETCSTICLRIFPSAAVPFVLLSSLGSLNASIKMTSELFLYASTLLGCCLATFGCFNSKGRLLVYFTLVINDEQLIYYQRYSFGFWAYVSLRTFRYLVEHEFQLNLISSACSSSSL